MAKAYWVARVSVTNEEDYPEYLKAGAPVYEKYGAKFVVRGGRSENLEGLNRARNVIVEFKDYDTALAAYNSPEYQKAKALRNANADSDVIIVEGVEE
jgi:uncharacterized protein (DUF1330 family)